MVVFLVLCSQSITQVPAQTFTLTVWIERGCGAEYHLGEMLKVHWEASHSCTITIYEEEPDGKKRKLTTQGIIAGAGHGSRGWTIKDYGYGRRVIHATASSEFGSDSDSCEYYVVQEDEDRDGVPDDQDDCYNPGCTIVDSRGCPRDSDGDGLYDCDDDCPTQSGPSSNDGCPVGDTDSDGVKDDEDGCYNPGCTIVDSQGCPRDTDGDGIRDCDDRCPDDYGERSNDGCPPPETDTPAPTTRPPTSPPPQPSGSLSLMLLALVVIAAVSFLVLLLKKTQKKEPRPPQETIPPSTRPYRHDTQLYDDTQIYDDETRPYDDDARTPREDTKFY